MWSADAQTASPPSASCQLDFWCLSAVIGSHTGSWMRHGQEWHPDTRERKRVCLKSPHRKHVFDSHHVCVPAARKDEKGRVFPGEVRRNPGAEEKVQRRSGLSCYCNVMKGLCLLCFCPWCCNHMMLCWGVSYWDIRGCLVTNCEAAAQVLLNIFFTLWVLSSTFKLLCCCVILSMNEKGDGGSQQLHRHLMS